MHVEVEGRNLFKPKNQIGASVSRITAQVVIGQLPRPSKELWKLWVLGTKSFKDIWPTFHTMSPEAWVLTLWQEPTEKECPLWVKDAMTHLSVFVQSSMRDLEKGKMGSDLKKLSDGLQYYGVSGRKRIII